MNCFAGLLDLGYVYEKLAKPEIALTYSTRSLESMENSKENDSFSDLIRNGKMVKTNSEDVCLLKRISIYYIGVGIRGAEGAMAHPIFSLQSCINAAIRPPPIWRFPPISPNFLRLCTSIHGPSFVRARYGSVKIGPGCCE